MSAGTTRIGPMEMGNNAAGATGGGSAILTMHSSGSFDMDQRDPNNLNQHLQVIISF